jgi:hypothetical protein
MADPSASPETAHSGSRSAPPTPAPTTASPTAAAAAAAAAAGNSGSSGELPLRPGHELAIPAPSSHLRPKPAGRTMSEKTPSLLDKEQMQGLVSERRASPETGCDPRAPSADHPLCEESYSRISQSPDKLRRAPALIPSYRSR